MAALPTHTSKPGASDKDVPSPPYSSFSISTPSSTIFLPLCPPPRANARTSHNAYIDDILIRSEVIFVQHNFSCTILLPDAFGEHLSQNLSCDYVKYGCHTG